MRKREHREVWRVDLSRALTDDECRARLSDVDWARAQRFRFSQHRRRYLVAHVALRDLLSVYLGVAARDLSLIDNAYGKPALADAPGLVFNLSHSEDLALIALASHGELGVDVEQCRALPHEDLARRNFSAVESGRLDRLAPGRRHEGFFACWTRKEAYIKAKGMGLSIPLDAFAVEADPDRAPALLESHHAPEDVGRFRFWDLPVPHGYRAALAHAPAEDVPDDAGVVLRDWNGWQ